MVFVRLESKEKGIPLGFWITTKKEISKEILEWSEENKRDLSKWSKEHKKNNDYKDIRIGILRTSKGQKMDASIFKALCPQFTTLSSKTMNGE